jgi:2-polyprenyl-3-methyl-5-hydroxy-6-metoxy-1,4-benzoquinol methylase
MVERTCGLHFWIAMQNPFEIYAHVNRPEMMDYIPTSATTILDVGCATGNFGASLKAERDVKVWGVEANSQAADVARTKLDGCFNSYFDRSLKLNMLFDCIVFNDVLEHMVDPYSALEFAKELLSNSGVIVASIPNVRFFDNVWSLLVHKNWEYRDAGILDRTHLRFFTRRSIEKMFADAGLRIETITGINPLETQSSYLITRFRVLNALFFNKIEDMRWLQYAVVARV